MCARARARVCVCVDPSLVAGVGDSSSSDDGSDPTEGARGPAAEPQRQQQPVEWREGSKVVTRVTAVLRVAAPGPAEDFGGVEWCHRHETKQAAPLLEEDDSEAAAAARAARLQRQQEESSGGIP